MMRVKPALLVLVTITSIFLFVIRVIQLASTQELSIGAWTAIILTGLGILALLAWTIHELAIAETLNLL